MLILALALWSIQPGKEIFYKRSEQISSSGTEPQQISGDLKLFQSGSYLGY